MITRDWGVEEKGDERKRENEREEGRKKGRERREEGKKERKKKGKERKRKDVKEKEGRKEGRLVVTRGHGELLFNGYRVLQDEKSSEDRWGELHNNTNELIPRNCTLKND